MRPFCRENLHVHKIPRFRGGGILGFWGGGGGSADFIFMGAGIFLIHLFLQQALLHVLRASCFTCGCICASLF